MSWITVAWSTMFGICLTLGALHLLIWLRARDAWASFFFALSAFAVAAMAPFEHTLLVAGTAEQYTTAWRWGHVPLAIFVMSLAWFAYLYLGSGRVWMVWLICGLRAVGLIVNFSSDHSLNFREITSLRQITLWGETISVPVGQSSPWSYISHAGTLLFLIFVVDASITAWKQGRRRRVLALSFAISLVAVLSTIMARLTLNGVLPTSFVCPLYMSVITVVAYDLGSELLRLARELHVTQDRMDHAAEAGTMGIWEWNTESDEIWTNPVSRSRIGLAEHESADIDRLLESIHLDDRERVRQTIDGSLSENDSFETEYRIARPRGDIRWIRSRGRLERDAEGAPLKVRAVSQDITALKQAESETQRQRDELSHFSRVSSMGHLATAIAHELNQPLGAILSNAEAAEMLLESDPPKLDDVREIIADIRRDDERAAEIIRRMRRFLRKRESQIELMDLNEIVRVVLRLVAVDAAMRQVATRLELAPEPLWIRADGIQMQQVLLNLVINAIEALDEVATDRRRLSIRTNRNAAGEVELQVIDSGPGIDPAKLNAPFEPFYTTKPDGLGMGIYVASTITSSFHGHLSAENNLDAGSTFRIRLPAADAETSARENA